MKLKIPTIKKRETDTEALKNEVKKQVNSQILQLIHDGDLKCAGYTSLDQDPTIITALSLLSSVWSPGISWRTQRTETGE